MSYTINIINNDTQQTVKTFTLSDIQVDIFKCTYTQFDQSSHPVNGDSITASAVPAISSGVKYSDSTLTGWTTSISVDDVLSFYVDSVTSITGCTINLKVRRT